MTYVISDIHGMYKKFIAMLEKISFTPEDELFILGDIVDRGDDPVKILEYIKPNIIPLLGNHEAMAIDINDKTFVLVHAGLGNFREDKRLSEYTLPELLELRPDYERQYFSDNSIYIVSGHTPTQTINGKAEIYQLTAAPHSAAGLPA